MKPPNIGAKLLARFSSVGTEDITIIRHGGWAETDGTYTDIDGEEVPMVADGVALHGAFFWGPVPSNMEIDPDINGDELRDAKWLWCLIEVSVGTTGSPPDARGPDRIRDNLSEKLYTVRTVIDPHRSQSGLYGALCTKTD